MAALSVPTVELTSAIRTPTGAQVQIKVTNIDTTADTLSFHQSTVPNFTPDDSTLDGSIPNSTLDETENIAFTNPTMGSVSYFKVVLTKDGEDPVTSNEVSANVPDIWDEISPSSVTWTNINVTHNSST